MLIIRDQILQLRAELTGCLLMRRERVQTNAELKNLLAGQAEPALNVLQAGPAHAKSCGKWQFGRCLAYSS